MFRVSDVYVFVGLGFRGPKAYGGGSTQLKQFNYGGFYRLSAATTH